MNKNSYWILATCIILISFTPYFYKAYHATFTHDEATNFLVYHQASIYEIFTFSPSATANNHILNSMLMQWSAAIFGIKEWSLRLPNLLAGLFFAWALAKICNRNTPDQPLWALTGLSLVLVNLYQLDFFSLARGYGLSLGCFILAVYFVSNPKNRIRPLYIAYLCSALSVLANFSMLVPHIALYLVHSFLFILSEKNGKKLLFSSLPFILSSLVLGLLIYYPILLLKTKNQLYYGGSHSFLEDTIGSLIKVYFKNHYLSNWGFLFRYAFYPLLGLGIWRTIALYKNQENWAHLIRFSALLLLAITIGHQLLFYALGVKFLIYRTALVYFPIIILLFWALLTEVYYRISKIFIRRGIALFIISFQLFLIPMGFNSETYRDWYYDTHNKNILADLEKSAKKNQQLSIQVYWLYYPSFRFYTKYGFYKNIKTEGFQRPLDYSILSDFYLLDYNKQNIIKLNEQYEVYKKYPNAILFKKLNSETSK